jgi:hypothetical protein
MKWAFLMPVIVTGLLESLVPHHHVLKTSLDVSEIIELKDYGRHIQIRDACQKDDTTYLVGGATTTQSSALGMDAFLFVYEGNELRHVESFGGMREDVFTTIHCESRLVLAGYSSSADFLAVPVNHFHRAFVLELSESFGVERLTVVDDPFQSTIHGLDVRGNHIVAVGHVQRIPKPILVIKPCFALFRFLTKQQQNIQIGSLYQGVTTSPWCSTNWITWG